MEYHNTGPAPGWWALTGTPGTGKSTVARSLPPEVLAVELRDLALRSGPPPPPWGPVEVDLRSVGAWMRRHLPPDPVIVAGYLAHRLPIERVIVLRCHPIALAERLRARPSSQRDLRENVQCEALDTIAGEARRGTRRTWELDTTHASPREVADRVRSLVRGSSERTDRVDWLDDPSVPPFLLRLSR